MVLSYDKAVNAFKGTIENTTDNTLYAIEVSTIVWRGEHGTTLDPQDAHDLAPGQVTEVTVPADNQPFESWTALLSIVY